MAEMRNSNTARDLHTFSAKEQHLQDLNPLEVNPSIWSYDGTRAKSRKSPRAKSVRLLSIAQTVISHSDSNRQQNIRHDMERPGPTHGRSRQSASSWTQRNYHKSVSVLFLSTAHHTDCMALVSCSDPRITPAAFLGLEFGGMSSIFLTTKRVEEDN